MNSTEKKKHCDTDSMPCSFKAVYSIAAPEINPLVITPWVSSVQLMPFQKLFTESFSMVLQGKDYPELVGHSWLHGHGDYMAAASLLCGRKLSLLNAEREKNKKSMKTELSSSG